MKKFGTFFEEFNEINASSWFFYVFFTVKRLALTLAIFLIASPLIQLIVSIVFTLAVMHIQMIFYLLETRPMKNKVLFVSVLSGEICTLIFYVFFILTFVSNINPSPSSQASMAIMILLANVGLNGIFSLISSVQGIKNWLKARKGKVLNTVAPITGLNNTELDQIIPDSKLFHPKIIS